MTDEPNTPDPEKNVGGRPSIYTPELRDKICAQLSEGKTLRAICRAEDMPDRSTIARWVIENMGEEKQGDTVITEGFYGHYTRARDLGLDVMADEVIEISDESEDDFIEVTTEKGNTKTVMNKEAVMRSRLRTDTRKWYLSKMAPKRYGNERTIRHQQLDADGNETDPVAPVSVGSHEILAAVHAEMKKMDEAREKEDDNEP